MKKENINCKRIIVVPTSVGTNPISSSKWLIFNKLVEILKVLPALALKLCTVLACVLTCIETMYGQN